MPIATLTSKGRTTIPKEIRDGLGLRPKDRLHFTLLADGTVIMRAKPAASANFMAPYIGRDAKPLRSRT
jgi:antitoxin PrlF